MSDVVPFKVLSAVVVLDATSTGWTLLEVPADGPRRYVQQVTFEQAFLAPPVVHVGIVGLDVSKEDNLRIRVRAFDITPSGFTVQAETWLNTKVWAVDVAWFAIGA